MRSASKLVFVILCGLWLRLPAAADSADPEATARQLGKLSLDLRGQPLTTNELDDVRSRLAQASPDAVYAHFVDAWLADDLSARGELISKVLSIFVPDDPTPLFFPLSTFHAADGRDVLYLPRRQAAANPPCAPADVVTVRPWWAKTNVAICAASYAPEVSFVEGTFCPQSINGVAGFAIPDACGCGPRLMYCAMPELLEAARADAKTEMRETTYDILIRQKRPLADVLTATRTWQSGRVQYLYARREAAQLIARAKWSPAVARQVDAIIDRVDVAAKPRWIDRAGPYRGTGVSFTAPGWVSPTYRNAIRELFNRFLCIDFGSVHVDRDAVLEAVGDNVQNLRSLNTISDSPMRHQTGCKGCHMPMDTSAGMLFGFELSWRGGFPRGDQPAGELYLQGATDRRGDGKGVAGLMKLIGVQPEFGRCMVKRVFAKVLDREPVYSERGEVAALLDEVAKNKRDLGWLVKRLLLGKAYREGM